MQVQYIFDITTWVSGV